MIDTQKIKWNAQGLLCVITTCCETDKVLMQAWMNEDALLETLETKRVCYYSRSRQQLWRKGETSGSFQHLKKAVIDCDYDCLLLTVKQEGSGACHTGAYTCFFKEVTLN